MSFAMLKGSERDTRPKITPLRDFANLIGYVGRQTNLRLYRHIHPHDHATSMVAEQFARFCKEHRGMRALQPEEVGTAALLHDIGKYQVDASIVLKPGKLTPEERWRIEHHSAIGNRIVVSSGLVAPGAISLAILHHHEHWQGTGYPDALHGTRIPLAARIVQIADTYISLREEREYKEAWPSAKALLEMERMAGIVLDPYLFEDFLTYHNQYRPQYRKQQKIAA